VAEAIAAGATNAEIATRLGLSARTVAVHVSHILAKLELANRSQIAAWVAKCASVVDDDSAQH
jgi:DNA-binding NarL/FixJ family response regulator